jgi:hypothetical protein
MGQDTFGGFSLDRSGRILRVKLFEVRAQTPEFRRLQVATSCFVEAMPVLIQRVAT